MDLCGSVVAFRPNGEDNTQSACFTVLLSAHPRPSCQWLGGFPIPVTSLLAVHGDADGPTPELGNVSVTFSLPSRVQSSTLGNSCRALPSLTP